MKKKSIIIVISVVIVLLGIILLLFINSNNTNEEKYDVLECTKDEVDEGKSATYVYKYKVNTKGHLVNNINIIMTYLNKEELDKYESTIRFVFSKGLVTRENNKMIIELESEVFDNKLTIEEIRDLSIEKGFECN